MAEHRDELFTQFGRLALRGQASLGGGVLRFALMPRSLRRIACIKQLTLISAPVHGLEDGQAREQQSPGFIPALDGIGDDR